MRLQCLAPPANQYPARCTPLHFFPHLVGAQRALPWRSSGEGK
jgi:hypothetical protein